MKIYVYKENEEIITKFKENDATVDFDYVVLINELFNKKKIPIEFDSNIDEEDKRKIESMYNDICKTIETDEEKK